MSIIWHNGEFRKDGAVFATDDRIRLGDGVFDTMLAVDGALIHGPAHSNRILHNAKTLEMDIEPFIVRMENVATELLERNNYQQGRYAINTLVSRGPGQRGLAPPQSPELQITMRAAPLSDKFSPIHAIIAQNVRRNEGSPLSRIKSFNYGDNILALLEAEKKGANEAIMLNNAGIITCATAGNIFVEKSGKLYTPPLSDGVLNGITRQILMEKMPVIEQSLKPEDLIDCDGIYLTNSIKGVEIVKTLNGKDMPNGLIYDDLNRTI